MICVCLERTLTKAGMTRYELAKKTGISYPIIDKYYKNKGMKVYHLKEGLEVIFREKQIPGSDYEDCPELYEKLNKWWEFWCIYARQFLDEDELHKSCVELADLLKKAVDNTPLSNV